MVAEKFDVIVIGAGMGGLSAATHLAKAGKRVLVLEHYVVPGGYAHEFTRGYYSFDVSLRALDGITPGSMAYPVLSNLGILDMIRFKRLNPCYVAEFPDHTIEVSADYLAYEEHLMKQFPHEAIGLRQLFNAMVRVFQDMRRFMSDKEQDWFYYGEPGIKHYPELYEAVCMTWHDFMHQFIEDPRLMATLSVLWNYIGLPPRQLSAAIFIFRWVNLHVFGGYYPEDGVMSLSWALVRIFKEHGGKIQYRQTVTNIEIQDGVAVGVETDKGLRFRADVIISNANAPDTMLKLVGEDYLPEEYAQKVHAAKPSLSNLVVYMGVDRDLKQDVWKHHEYFTTAGYDCDAAYEAVQAGRFEEADMSITYYNVYYPTCAPRGGSVVSLYHLAPWNYADYWGTGGDMNNYQNNERYQEIKGEVVAKMLERAERYIPGLRDSIVYQEVATPLTNMRFSRNPGGSFTGSELTVENTFLGRLHTTTPLSNVFMTGAWVGHFGVSSALISGRDTARLALKTLDG